MQRETLVEILLEWDAKLATYIERESVDKSEEAAADYREARKILVDFADERGIDLKEERRKHNEGVEEASAEAFEQIRRKPPS